jgi:NAD(P)-dependent dehydrogenase (short-subunit alcohol dehydrogenase family)
LLDEKGYAVAIEINLAGRNAIVTGAGRGIGRETARHLARAGARVIAADLDGPSAKETANLIEAAGGQARGAQLDVRDYAQAKSLVDSVVGDFGTADILVNNAAIWTIKWFQDMEPADYDRDIGVVLFGTLTMTRAVYDTMREQRSGAIVNMISDSARIGEPMVSVYAAAKGGVMAFTKTLAREAGRFGIRVNGVSPSTTRTPGSEGMIDKWGGEERIKKLYPLGRLGDQVDHANAILYLCSDMGAWVTGQILSVNGGFTMPD